MEEILELVIAWLLMGFMAGLLFFKLFIMPSEGNIFDVGGEIPTMSYLPQSDQGDAP